MLPGKAVKTIGIILARGGSKRVPGKNKKLLHGKPLVAWSVHSALKSGAFDVLIVSTDDLEIKEIAKNAGADVPFLRASAFDDEATSSEATVTSLVQAESFFDCKFDRVVQMMASCPLKTAGDIVASLQNFSTTSALSQISVSAPMGCNPWWSMVESQKGSFNSIFSDVTNKKSQDLPELYIPNGAVWVAERDILLKEKTFYASDFTCFPVPWISGFDIDTEDDFALANVLLKSRHLVAPDDS